MISQYNNHNIQNSFIYVHGTSSLHLLILKNLMKLFCIAHCPLWGLALFTPDKMLIKFYFVYYYDIKIYLYHNQIG